MPLIEFGGFFLVFLFLFFISGLIFCFQALKVKVLSGNGTAGEYYLGCCGEDNHAVGLDGVGGDERSDDFRRRSAGGGSVSAGRG